VTIALPTALPARIVAFTVSSAESSLALAEMDSVAVVPSVVTSQTATDSVLDFLALSLQAVAGK
jgi:hypothetical protein